MLRAMPALAESIAVERESVLLAEPWLWSASRDLWLFGGSALGALLIVALGHAFGFAGGPLPEWAFLVFVLGVDVAHVYATLFRTYLDPAELRARPMRYVLTPLAAYVVGVAAFSFGAMVFWRGLAYFALFHFVRQEIGWLRVQRAKSSSRGSRFDARLDELALYVSALYPLWLWHTALAERRFSWFVVGDFFALPESLAWLTSFVRLGFGLVLAAFVLRQLWLYVARRLVRPLPCLIVGKTALIWYVGIVLCNSDFDFTVTNVLAHGVPYLGLLWVYARERAQEPPRAIATRVARAGRVPFFALLLTFAAFEEGLWDRLVNHDHPWLFGVGPELSSGLLRFLVPLLAVPQLSHYLLDARLWRAEDTQRLPAQQRALGFSPTKEIHS